jgi:hypothetical protein
MAYTRDDLARALMEQGGAVSPIQKAAGQLSVDEQRGTETSPLHRRRRLHRAQPRPRAGHHGRLAEQPQHHLVSA